MITYLNRVRRLKKIRKLLKSLDKLKYRNHHVDLNDLINEAEMDLVLYEIDTNKLRRH